MERKLYKEINEFGLIGNSLPKWSLMLRRGSERIGWDWRGRERSVFSQSVDDKLFSYEPGFDFQSVVECQAGVLAFHTLNDYFFTGGVLFNG